MAAALAAGGTTLGADALLNGDVAQKQRERIVDSFRSGKLDVGFVEASHLVEVEAVEGGAERLALAQDRQPRQAGLEGLQRQPLEQRIAPGIERHSGRHAPPRHRLPGHLGP